MVGMRWKRLVSNSETISYIKEKKDYRVIIEARQSDDGWEVVKKYLGSGLNFAETYNAASSQELKRMLKNLRSEKDLSRDEIENIAAFKKKNLKVFVRRGWKEANVEKWNFSIGDDYTNYVIARYGKEVEIDIVMEEQLKYIEDRIIDNLYDVLGIDEELGIIQNVYYFTKKSSSQLDPMPQLDLEFMFE